MNGRKEEKTELQNKCKTKRNNQETKWTSHIEVYKIQDLSLQSSLNNNQNKGLDRI